MVWQDLQIETIAKIPGETLLRNVLVRKEMTRNWIVILKLVQTKIKFDYFNGINGPTGDRVKSKRLETKSGVSEEILENLF